MRRLYFGDVRALKKGSDDVISIQTNHFDNGSDCQGFKEHNFIVTTDSPTSGEMLLFYEKLKEINFSIERDYSLLSALNIPRTMNYIIQIQFNQIPVR